MISALSKYYKGVTRDIVTPITITNIFNGKTENTQAIWDTGATGSVITKDIASKLGLMPVSKCVVMGVHGKKEVNIYRVRFTLNNKDISVDLLVTECDALTDGKSALIGMDIITRGDFCITNVGGNTTMTFRVPSVNTIDFVSEMKENDRIKMLHKSWMKHGNDKCPCGSGKKYKNCHGKEQG